MPRDGGGIRPVGVAGLLAGGRGLGLSELARVEATARCWRFVLAVAFKRSVGCWENEGDELPPVRFKVMQTSLQGDPLSQHLTARPLENDLSIAGQSSG